MGDNTYTEEGVPICENCEKVAEECECWQNEAAHEIIAWQLANGVQTSEFLQVKDEPIPEEADDEV